MTMGEFVKQEYLGSFVPPEYPSQKMPWSRNVQGVSISKLTLLEHQARTFELGNRSSQLRANGLPEIEMVISLVPGDDCRFTYPSEVLPEYLPYALASKMNLSPSMRTLYVLGNVCIWDGKLRELGDSYLMSYRLNATPNFAAERALSRETLEIMEEWALQHAWHETRWPEGPIRYLLGLFIRSRDWGQ